MASRNVRLARRLVLMLVFIVVVYGGVIGVNRFFGAKILQAIASAPRPEISVSVATAEAQVWQGQLKAIATLKAAQGTLLTAQASGNVTALYFDSGQEVKKGQLLVQLNNNLARAQLASDRAKLVNAQQEIDRQRTLFAHHATSKAALDSAEAAYREANAAIDLDEAQLENLQIRAPFSGHLGIRLVSLGQYVSPGTSVVDIQQWDPLRVDFSLPQRDLSRVGIGDPVQLTVDGIPQKVFAGHITALGSAVASDTRTVPVEAEVPNSKNELRPGMFGEITVLLNERSKVLTVPATAITYNTYGEYLYVVQNSKTGKVAQQRVVQTGDSRNGRVSIIHGVQPGDVVVIAGQVNLYPDAPVRIVAAPGNLKNLSGNTGS